jgi:ribosomal protein S18 acetylase RimI-like enzyme
MADRDAAGWPAHLHPGAVRFARTSHQYDDTIAFYRDLVGLPVVDEFHASFGEDGTIFGLPNTTVQLEIVRAHEPAAVGTLDQLVLYLHGAAAVDAATSRLAAAGASRTQPHPYWAANGAVVYQDPDGRDVVFAPWVYGRDPEPAVHAGGEVRPDTDIEWYDGDRARLRHLFVEAEDSTDQLDAYISDGRVLVARRGDEVLGHLQLVQTSDRVTEIKNMAVAAELRGTGIGRRLVDQALVAAGSGGSARVVVAAAAADNGNLRFYQRCGVRFAAIDRDAFTPQTGYPQPIDVDGIPLRDRVWLDQPVPRDPAET